LSVQDVWKQFRIPHEKRTTVVDNIAAALSVFEGKRFSYEEFWALREVSFSLASGESLGIIGPNGSGKSTLLKVIAGIMKPDRGRIEAYGPMVPILELGVGFHGDLTVTENTLVYGVLMGIPRTEVKKRTADILEFAGLTNFADTRLKHLSTGMQVRLGFSIAIQTNSEIFLVDEALAVGDIEFQERCLDKFREFRKEGKSIVLVSHSLDLINSFCEKTLYLLSGNVKSFGESLKVTQQYLQDLRAKMALVAETVPKSPGTTKDDGGVNSAMIMGHNFPEKMRMGESFTAKVRVWNLGSTTWTKAKGYFFGFYGENPPVGPADWVPVDEFVSVQPGQDQEFTFTIIPVRPGTFTLRYKMVQKGVEWFGQSMNVHVTIVET